MLCDTGAFCNCISRTFYEAHLTGMTSLLPCEGGPRLTAANNSTMATMGKVSVTFRVGGCALTAEFYVVDALTQDVILGVEFMERTGALLDYKHKRMSLYDGTVSAPLLTAIDPELAVCTVQNVRIPAEHEAIIPVRLPRRLDPTLSLIHI